MSDAILTRDGPVSVPMDYTVPNGGELLPLTVRATIDGTSAASAFLAAVQVIAPSGRVMANAISEGFAAGASADVTWFPKLSGGQSSSATGSGPAVLFDQTLTGTSGGFDTGANGIPLTHNDLLVVTYLRTTEATEGTETAQVQINGDTVGTYKSLRIIAHNTTVFGQNDSPGGWFCMSGAGATANAGNYAPNLLYIPNYQAPHGHFGLSLQGVIPTSANFTNANVELGVHSYNAGGTNPITRLAVQPNVGGGALFAAGSRCTIYGMG